MNLKEKFELENGYNPYAYDKDGQIIGYCENYVEWLEKKIKENEPKDELEKLKLRVAERALYDIVAQDDDSFDGEWAEPKEIALSTLGKIMTLDISGSNEILNKKTANTIEK